MCTGSSSTEQLSAVSYYLTEDFATFVKELPLLIARYQALLEVHLALCGAKRTLPAFAWLTTSLPVFAFFFAAYHGFPLSTLSELGIEVAHYITNLFSRRLIPLLAQRNGSHKVGTVEFVKGHMRQFALLRQYCSQRPKRAELPPGAAPDGILSALAPRAGAVDVSSSVASLPCTLAACTDAAASDASKELLPGATTTLDPVFMSGSPLQCKMGE